jgi:hypothetical protein
MAFHNDSGSAGARYRRRSYATISPPQVVAGRPKTGGVRMASHAFECKNRTELLSKSRSCHQQEGQLTPPPRRNRLDTCGEIVWTAACTPSGVTACSAARQAEPTPADIQCETAPAPPRAQRTDRVRQCPLRRQRGNVPVAVEVIDPIKLPVLSALDKLELLPSQRMELIRHATRGGFESVTCGALDDALQRQNRRAQPARQAGQAIIR